MAETWKWGQGQSIFDRKKIVSQGSYKKCMKIPDHLPLKYKALLKIWYVSDCYHNGSLSAIFNTDYRKIGLDIFISYIINDCQQYTFQFMNIGNNFNYPMKPCIAK